MSYWERYTVLSTGASEFIMFVLVPSSKPHTVWRYFLAFEFTSQIFPKCHCVTMAAGFSYRSRDIGGVPIYKLLFFFYISYFYIHFEERTTNSLLVMTTENYLDKLKKGKNKKTLTNCYVEKLPDDFDLDRFERGPSPKINIIF
jgi:hypothetical protein